MDTHDELNDIRRRAGLQEQARPHYPYEWNEKTIVWEQDGFRIAINNPSDATYITLWDDNNKRVGTLATSRKSIKKGNWLTVSHVDIEAKKGARGLGLGLRMYQILLQYMNPEYDGLIGYKPDIVNKKQVPRIYQRLGAADEPDYWVVPNPNHG
jgi:hypothetical protein